MVFLYNIYDRRTVYQCSYCYENVNIRDYYIFKVTSLDEHNNKYICIKCLESELKKKM